MPDRGYSGPLEKVNATLWRIPKRYKEGMRVDGLIYASHELMQHLKADQAPEQVANVAHLPGIQVASLAMPDIHWGYGFPIGGVAATDPAEGGVISPGGVGYDINCLAGDARVLHAHGYTRPIAEMAEAWPTARLACYALGEPRRDTTDVALWFSRPPGARVLRVVTASGDALRATADHPVWTPDGMRPLGELRPGDRVALAPFEGVPYAPPTDDVIVSEDDVRARLAALGKGGGNGIAQALAYLGARGLLPLRRSSPALPYLLKILGFVFGDGTLHFEGGTGKGVTAFYGQAADLAAIRADIAALGVTPSRLYTRQRRHRIQTAYAAYEFEREECYVKASSTGFAALLACLGAPVGNKTQQAYDLPAWLDAAPLWQRRLFLAALFGAELTAPATITGHPATLAAPVLSLNKRAAFAASGRAFLDHIARWLADFGVATQAIAARDEGVRGDGERAVRLRLILSPKADSLLALWGRVGFEYNARRAGLAALAVQYLKRKACWLAQRDWPRRVTTEDTADTERNQGGSSSPEDFALSAPALQPGARAPPRSGDASRRSA